MQDRARVLFLNSPLTIGADTWIHLLLLRHLPQERLALHVAGQPAGGPAAPSPAFEALQEIPGLVLRATDFGPSLSGQSRVEKLHSVASLLPVVASLSGLVRYIRREGIQIIHSTDRPRDAIACATLAALTGAKSVIHVHVKYDDWMSRGVKWALRRADMLVGVSDFVARSLLAGGYRSERVRSVLNAVDPKAWDPSLSSLPGRETLGVASGTPLIVSVARLFHWKGHGELVRALALVKRALPEVRLAIVGADYPAGSGTTRALMELARELGVLENIIFTGQRRDIAALLAASDLFALPSFEEPFGLVFAEAMAMRRPVVGLNNGGTPEVVEHGRTGLLSDPADVDGLAANLLSLLRDRPLRERMGEAGRRRVESLFAPSRMANDFASLYAQMVG